TRAHGRIHSRRHARIAARSRVPARGEPRIAPRRLTRIETQVDAFLEDCPTWWRPYFGVAFWTGARPNELAALKWGDFDGASARFRIRAGRYRGVESAPKTAGSVRDVDCLPPVLEALRAQKAQQDRKSTRL